MIALGGQVLAALAAVLALAWLGRLAALRLGQPEVIGEIVAGLVAGPALLRITGSGTFHRLLPDSVLGILKHIAVGALVLFVVWQCQHLRVATDRLPRRATAWVVTGAFLPPLAAGATLAGFVLLTGDRAARGPAPAPAFVLTVAVALAVTAVPVLARILADRKLTTTVAGRLALTAAIIIDTAAWLLLSVAIGLRGGELTGFLRSTGVLGCGLVAALVLRLVLRTRMVSGACARVPRVAAVVLGVVALAVATVVERAGLTAIFGAVIVGVAVPAGGPWARVAGLAGRAGTVGVPVFFVVTGVTVFTTGWAGAPWLLIALAVGLGLLGKLGGGSLGARLGGQPVPVALRVGVLMNTRGLTELIVLQVGYSAGVLSTAMFVALLVMALATTAVAGPLLRVVDRLEARAGRRRPVREGVP
jgi:Kef-type K+ transport system membrane component KefB